MPELDDHELLAEFAGTHSEPAFAALVARHLNLVYSTALRFTGNSHHAEEITQAVFIILAQKAGKLSARIVLSGWLYQVARFTAANFLKGEIRRQHREQEVYMQTILNEPDALTWQQIAPLLDEAMGGLGETDRNAIVLRFFENQTAAEAAAQLNLTEAAAHKRVNRALEKLRKFFTKRGVISTTAIIAGAISANSVQAAPVTLIKTISVVAAAKGAAASASTLTLIKGALKIMAWTKAKIAVVVSIGAVLVAGTATVVVISKMDAPLQPIKTLPNPNGYDDLLKAGEMTALNTLDYNTATLEQLRSVTAANAGALALARAGLNRECRVPVQYTEAYNSNHLDDLSNIKKLAQAFVAEGKFAEKENHLNDAAKSYLDAVHLGNESARGGTLIDQMVGTACEAIGASALQNITGQLDAKSCHETAAALETFDAQKQTWNEVMQQEHDWSVRTFTGIRYKITRRMTDKLLAPAFAATKRKFEQRQIETRQLMIDLAARAYGLDQGHPPASLADLVPAYLKAVPQDPITGTNMAYSPK